MAQLPLPKASDSQLSMTLSRWKSILDPVIAGPTNQSNILTGIALKNGVTVINHLLGRQMQGWSIVDIDAAATIYRSSPLNEKTLTLTSNAAANVSIEVF